MLKYFLPDWEDRLDPNFDFLNDQFSLNHKKNPYENDFYAHQLFENPPYDGILVSLAIFEKKISLTRNGEQYELRGKNNIKEYLKIPEKSSLEVMGDCGAFSYVKEKEPPKFYNVENIAKLYQNLGFDYGVSVDHLAVDYIFLKNPETGKREKKSLPDKEKDRRIKITLRNAKDFLKLHKKNNYDFLPVGVAQGYSVDTYRFSVKKLVDMGYDYIALGGLVQYKTDFIIEILEGIQPFINNIKLHLFGVLRPAHLHDFEKLGVTSFDSTSFFRKAWLRSGQNYLAVSGEWYTAIRVPQSTNNKFIDNAKSKGFSIKKVQKMEKNALNALCRYDQDELNVDDVLDVVVEYDEILLRNSEDNGKLREKYLKTLLEKPWKSCDCPMCKNLGINTVIFRGTNRNKRRGFHNLWAFRKNIEDSSSLISDQSQTLCVIPCGSKKIWDKNPKAGPVMAKEVYISSFAKKCKEYAEKFYPDSWRILSAKYGFLSPNDIVPKTYNVTFNSRKDDSITLNELCLQIEDKNLDEYDEIVVLGGKNYVNTVKKVFPKKEIINPLNGCRGIGYMMNRLNSLINS